MERDNENFNIISLNIHIISENIEEWNFRESIQTRRQQRVDELIDSISMNFGIEVESIWNQLIELRVGTPSEFVLNNGDTITVHERLREVSLYPISGVGERNNIQFSNLESVSSFKQRIVTIISSNEPVDALVLFCNVETFDDNTYKQNVILLEDSKFMRDYDNISGSHVAYFWISELGDNIQLGKKLHNGSFSKVFKAIGEDNRKFVIKKYISVEQTHKQIWRELFAFQRLRDNPRIIQLISLRKDDCCFYVVMEYMRKGSLQQYVKVRNPLTVDLVRKWAKQILEGLVYLHGERVIHCDLKTSCILLDESEDIKISGFDMAKYVGGQTEQVMCDGFSTSRPGTYNYMAPEILNELKASTKSDIWSFGAILVELVTGKIPFEGMASNSVFKQISRDRKIHFKFPEGTSSSLINLINICLEENYNKRLNAVDLLNHDFFL